MNKIENGKYKKINIKIRKRNVEADLK